MSNPSVDEIAGYAAKLGAPALMVGVDSNGIAFVRVENEDDYDDDGHSRSRDFAFESIVHAKIAFDELRGQLADLRRQKSFRHQLEALQVSGRCGVDIRDDALSPSFWLRLARKTDGLPIATVVVFASADRAMQDGNSLAKLVEAVEEFTRREGL